MIPALRSRFNRSFSEAKYESFIRDLNTTYNLTIPFRVAESPVFIPPEFRKKLFAASDSIIDFLVRQDYKELTAIAIPKNCLVPNETEHTLFLALDFAIVRDDGGQLQPRLIELQGFPSLFGFQDFLSLKFKEHFDIPSNVSGHFGLTSQEYLTKIKRAIVGEHDPENVVLLELDPMKQNTAIDFVVTQHVTGVPTVDLKDVQCSGQDLFYEKNGKKIRIERIYNRVIFDELLARKDDHFQFDLTKEVNVEWAGHPNWFFRISKYAMPLIKSPFVPECKFLSDFRSFPADLENYVLKPLFSFSGTGVIFNVKIKDLENIPAEERGNFILQRKVNYEPVIQSPDGLVKAEIRLMFIWEDGTLRPVAVTNLTRLSRGEMIGVKFNRDKTWVGGSVSFFEDQPGAW